MSHSDHTPTPWEAQFHTTATGKPFGIIVGGNSKNGRMDVVICHGPDSHTEPVSYKAFQDGNANVLAAANDLLAALGLYALPFADEKQARAEFGDASVDRELARRAAIQKATAGWVNTARAAIAHATGVEP